MISKVQAASDVKMLIPAMTLPPFLRLRQTQKLSGKLHDGICKNDVET